MVCSILIGVVVGAVFVGLVNTIHYRTTSMEYGDGQVLMLLLDTYPDLTTDARDALVGYLKDGYITKCEHDIIFRQATRAVFFGQGDMSIGKYIRRNPC